MNGHDMMTRAKRHRAEYIEEDDPIEDFEEEMVEPDEIESEEIESEDDVIVPFINSNQRIITLTPDQQSRLDRMRKEPLYLLDVLKGDSMYKFKVSGSTANVYTLKLDPSADQSRDLVRCDCPDAALGARFRKCHCKHACFLLVKVCSMPEQILAEGPISDQDRYLLLGEAHKVDQNRNWDGLTNAAYMATYNRVIYPESDNSFDVPAGYVLGDGCPICFDDQAEKNGSAMCPQCKKCFHKDCIAQWLAISRTTCPLCRGSWTGYDKANDGEMAKGKGFLNLGAGT
jgi:hypothetical protein